MVKDVAHLRFLLLAALSAGLTCPTRSQVPANQDTIRIPGDSITCRCHAGLLESTINGDTTGTGARANPNRVYALNEGQCYFQIAPINVHNVYGTLTIVGIPSPYGTTKPVILIAGSRCRHVVIHRNGTNLVYGSIRLENVHYQTMALDGWQNRELFYCGTADSVPQSLTVHNCLFEFSNIDLFDCSDEPGAIGGWPFGAKFRFTNSYFRNMFNPHQRSGSRIFQCKHPIDTLWVENCTVTTGGITFFQDRQLTDFTYINHNTFVNNSKSWLFSPYHRLLFVTSNIFINQNWTGEDSLCAGSGRDPDGELISTINIDTNNVTNGLIVQPKYMLDPVHLSPLLNLEKLRVFVSDNINYYDPLLVNGYYHSTKYTLPCLNALPAYIGRRIEPVPLRNIPCVWMNHRTQNLFYAYGGGAGGFKEKRTSTYDPGTVTRGIADAAVVDSMAVWNQHLWGDPRFPVAPSITSGRYIYGDYDPTTLPGIVDGMKTDTAWKRGAGISKFTDLTENFSQSVMISAIDGLPEGALIWDDIKLAAYNSENDRALVYAKYLADGFPVPVTTGAPDVPPTCVLSQNYPNPFNPSTSIRYALPRRAHVTLAVVNTLGQQVATLVDGAQEPGEHTVILDAGGLASGVYYCRLQTGGYVKTVKMVLLK